MVLSEHIMSETGFLIICWSYELTKVYLKRKEQYHEEMQMLS